MSGPYIHDVVIASTGGDPRYFWVLYCRKCGYVFMYGNEHQHQDRAKERQKERPLTCIGDYVGGDVPPVIS